MARVTMVPQEPEDARLRAMFDEVRARGIAVPHLYRVLGLAPPMLRAWLDFAWPLRLETRTPRALRELLILRGAQTSHVDYEWAHHVPMALAAGVTRAQIDALPEWRAAKAELFDAREKAVLRLAEEVTAGPAASAECVEELKRHFVPGEIVELVLTASFYVCVGRVLRSFEIELEPGVDPAGGTGA